MLFHEVRELLTIVGKQDNEAVKKIIKEERFYGGAPKNTLLHLAAKSGNRKMVQSLVDLGSEIDARNVFGQTPLMMCLESEIPSKKVIKILLTAGADIFATNNFRTCSVQIVESSGWLKEDIERIEIYKMFIEKADNFSVFTSLKTANKRIIEMLLKTNADLSATDCYGNTLVHMIAQNRTVGVMTLLHGKSFDINVRGWYKWTPLIYATLSDASSSMEFLLEKGADTEAADQRNQTALYFACRYSDNQEKQECIQLLLEHGANAQIEVRHVSCPTILDVVLENKSFAVGEMVLAQLALQEAKGTEISLLIRSKIKSNDQFKNYFEQCKQQLPVEIHRSGTVFDLLTASDTKLGLYLRNNELTSKLADLQTKDFFKTMLQKRVSKAIAMLELKKSATTVVCKLMKIEYDSYPCIVDEIVNYLEKKDVECLVSIEI